MLQVQIQVISVYLYGLPLYVSLYFVIALKKDLFIFYLHVCVWACVYECLVCTDALRG